MELSDYQVGDRVEVLLLDAWHPAVVTNPETPLISLIADLTDSVGVHVAVTDSRKIRPVAEAGDARAGLIQGTKLTLASADGDEWSGTVVRSGSGGALLINLD